MALQVGSPASQPSSHLPLWVTAHLWQCPASLGLWLLPREGIPHPHLQDWVIPGSSKPLSAWPGLPSLIPSLSVLIRWLQVGVWTDDEQWAAAGLAGPAGQSSEGQAPAWATEKPGAMRVAVGMLWLLALGVPPQTQGACPSQCSCSLHVLSDGSKARYGPRSGGVGRSAPEALPASLGWEGLEAGS